MTAVVFLDNTITRVPKSMSEVLQIPCTCSLANLVVDNGMTY